MISRSRFTDLVMAKRATMFDGHSMVTESQFFLVLFCVYFDIPYGLEMLESLDIPYSSGAKPGL